MTERTFKVPMKGDDIAAWQEFLVERFAAWSIAYPLAHDGDYGPATRAATATFIHAWGGNSGDALSSGLSVFWRSKLRDDRRSAFEEKAFHSATLLAYRRALRDRFQRVDVCYPVANLITDAWGWHPGVHDGIDLLAPWKQPLLAICTGKIVRAAKDGWWHLGAKPSPGHPISDGDGIIILECGISAGPFKPGLHFGYGHAENATVKEGEHVKAGQVIGHIGFANAAHTHFMVNDDAPVNGLYRGIGDRDPKPFLDFAGGH